MGMNWRSTGRMTGTDMAFIAGVLIGAGIAVVVVIAGVLWVAKLIVGG